MSQERKDYEATFRVGPFVNFSSLLRSLDCDPVPLIKQFGLDPMEFNDPDHRLPTLRVGRLLAKCVEVTGCDHLGLLLGERGEPSHLGMAGFLLHAAPSVEMALHALVENLDLHEDGGVATLDIDSDYTSLGYGLPLEGLEAAEQVCDLSMVMMTKIMRSLCGEDWVASTVKMVRKEPEQKDLYRRFFRTAVFFDSTECSVTFKSECLKQKPPSADKLLYNYLVGKAEQLHQLQSHEMLEELPGIMIKGLLSGKFSAAQIADAFGVHERTLHRRLRAAGTNFRRELDRARQSVSEQLLGSTNLPVCDVANALGYADSSGFIRAFQRWSGASPSAWRKQNSSRLKAKGR